MKSNIDPRAKTIWDKSDTGYKNYQVYITGKTNRFELTLIDLLYISNFKGGYAIIGEKEQEVNVKLRVYSEKLREINRTFDSKKLSQLTDAEIKKLVEDVESVVVLTHKKNSTKIDGFGPSYLSALLSSFFPELIPILDRRILLNLKLADKNDLNSQGQVKSIEKFYGRLIQKIAKIVKKSTSKTIRDIDREEFIKKIE
jgi:hypothetical protein